MHRIADPPRFIFNIPLTLLLLNIASFGVLLPWLGFYWDDWPSIWFLHFLGPSGFARVFAEDRPLLGLLFRLTTPLFGESALAWQIFGFLARWLSCLTFWQFLRLALPQRPRLADWAAIFFSVYPGFSQQYISVTYSNAFLLQALFFASMGWMVQALKSTKAPLWNWFLYGLSYITAAFTHFAVEYYFGLELLRPLLIWCVHKSSQARQRLLYSLALWMPFMALMVFFVAWRVYFTSTPRGNVTLLENLRTDPASAVNDLLFDNVLPDMVESSLLAWGQTLNLLRLQNFGLVATLGFAAIALLASLLVMYWMLQHQKKQLTDPSSGEGISLILVGLFALFAGGWPFWATNLPIELRFPWDRFTLAMMPGASLLLAGLIDLLSPWRRWQAGIFAFLVGLAISGHFETANLYRREWNLQKAFFWQLTWRAPALQPGTVLVTSELPFIHFSDNSLTAPLNWIYTPERLPTNMPFALLSIESRLGDELTKFEPGLPIRLLYRATQFTGTTDQAIVFYYSPPGCVKILDPGRDARLPQKPKFLSEAMRLSRLDLIVSDTTTSAQPPVWIFGSEPPRNWCYFFEKAELAYQSKNWEEINQLGEQAFNLGIRLYEINAPEYLPYIEASARTGEWTTAAELSRQALQLSPRMNRSLCSLWDRLLADMPASPELNTNYTQLRKIMQCQE